MRLVNAVSDPRDGTITLYERTEGGIVRRAVVGEYVSYLAKQSVTRDLLRMLRSSRHVSGVVQEGDWVRVAWRTRSSRENACDPREGWFAKNNIDTYEADLPPLRRWMADHEDVQIVEPRRVFLDIETDARVPMSRKEEMRIISWAMMTIDGEVLSHCLEDDTDRAEKCLLTDLWRTLERFDQVLAWNGDGFDFPVIFARSKLHQIPVDARRWLWLDQMELFRRMNVSASESGDEKQSVALQSVAMTLLGIGKIEGFSGKGIFEAWEKGGAARRQMIEYNQRDVELMIGIEKKTGYVALLQTLCEVTRVFPDTYGISPMPQVEQFMMRLARQHNVHFKTRERTFDEDDEQTFQGAYVMAPKSKGIITDVHVVDFSAMYPSIVLSFNMSPETVREPEREPTLPSYLLHLKRPKQVRPAGHCEVPGSGVLFQNEPRGLLAIALDELIRLRKQWAKKASELPPGTPEWADAMRKSTAYKIAANSFFGVVGAPISRLHDEQVAGSITGVGVWLINNTLTHARARFGMDVVYGDTDSGFLRGASDDRVREFVDNCNSELYPKLLQEQGCSRNFVKLAYEKKFERVMFIGAKRYIGRWAHYKGTPADENSKPEIKGLEYKRGDTVRVARRLQAEVIDLLMGGGVEMPGLMEEAAHKTKRRPDCEDKPESFMELCEIYRDIVLHSALTSDDVKQSKRLTRPLKEYVAKRKKDGTDGALPPHVRVAKILAERGGGVGEGSRIEYFVVDGASKQLAPIEDWTGEFDRFTFWEDYVWKATERLLSAAFPQIDWQRQYGRVRPKKGTEGTMALTFGDAGPRKGQGAIMVEGEGSKPTKGPKKPQLAGGQPQLGIFDLGTGRLRH